MPGHETLRVQSHIALLAYVLGSSFAQLTHWCSLCVDDPVVLSIPPDIIGTRSSENQIGSRLHPVNSMNIKLFKKMKGI